MISAELLIKEGYHASSVHCSYYGLFQKMKHTIKKHLNLSKSDYDKNAEGMSSHKFLIDLIKKEAIKNGTSRKEIETITNTIYELKSLRQDADYEDFNIGSDESNGAYDMSIKLISSVR